MDSFAFVIHPIDPKRDVRRKFPLLGRIFNENQIHFLSKFFPPVFISEIEGVRSKATGKSIHGCFVACPLTTRQILRLPLKTVYRKIIQTGRLAERLGARILGLGAFTSVVGDAGITIARKLDIPVTTGDAYTVATAIEAIQRTAKTLNVSLEDATTAVLGATGAIGRNCAEILAFSSARVILVGRRQEALSALQQRLVSLGAPATIEVSTQIGAIRQAHFIISVTSSLKPLIQSEHIQPGSVVCDIAMPRDVSSHVMAARKDVLIIDGGVVDVPGNVDFHFDFGLPAGKAYACMAETMALALEGRFEDYTLGRDFSREHVQEIAQITHKHGFELSRFRSFDQEITADHLNRIQNQMQARI